MRLYLARGAPRRGQALDRVSLSVRSSPVRVIAVIDLRGGRAVHALAGARQRYAPVRAAAGIAIAGDPLALARTYVNRLGITELYVADLDAILGGPVEDSVVPAIAALGDGGTRGPRLWLDAAVTSPERARQALRLGASQVVVGLETLPSYDALAGICAAAGSDRIVFSLDLRDGAPILAGGFMDAGEPAHLVAARAAAAGAGAVIVIDLARVGTGRGVDVEAIARVRDAVPHLPVLAGGGVGGPADLARLADAGCDGVLIATALHDGRIGAADLAFARQRRRPQTRPGR